MRVQVLAGLVFQIPTAFAQLLGGDTDGQGRLIDRWLMVASTRCGNIALATVGALPDANLLPSLAAELVA